MSNNVNDVLKQLDAINKSTGISVYIPSLKKIAKFKTLNLKQQKELLKSSVDETLTKLAFITAFYKIIEENNLENVDINSLYTFDRNVIALTLRAHGLNEIYKTKDVEINLIDLINSIPNITIQEESLFTTITVDSLRVELKAAQLGVDRDTSIATINKLKTTQERDIKGLVGELFIHEIIKFIQSVTVTVEDTEHTSVFSELKIDDRIAIVEKFPSTLTNKVLEFIKTYRDLENKFTTLDDSSVEIDGSFFSV